MGRPLRSGPSPLVLGIDQALPGPSRAHHSKPAEAGVAVEAEAEVAEPDKPLPPRSRSHPCRSASQVAAEVVAAAAVAARCERKAQI